MPASAGGPSEVELVVWAKNSQRDPWWPVRDWSKEFGQAFCALPASQTAVPCLPQPCCRVDFAGIQRNRGRTAAYRCVQRY